MTIDDLQKELDRIDPKLFINLGVDDEFEGVNYSGYWNDFVLYDAKNHVFNDEACNELLEGKRCIFKKLINKYRNDPYKYPRKDNQMTKENEIRLAKLENEAGKYVEIEGEAASQDELQEAIKRTQKDNRPMDYYSRAIVYVDGKIAAVITNNDFEYAENVAVRLKPVYDK